MKIIFMGTPDFAVGTLQAIIDAGHEVVCVVTQPDKPKGRGKGVAMSPVKECALENGLKVITPVKVRVPEVVEELRDYNADAIVVVAFGQILPKSILEMTRFGCINVHASLLPKYRGAAPIQWAVINGEKESGVTIMQMDEGIDTGAILKVGRLILDEKETGGSLFDRLAAYGASLLVETLKGLEEGSVHATPQSGESTYAGKLDKSLGRLDFTRSAAELERLIRGLNPWPSAYTMLDKKMLKIWEAQVIDKCPKCLPGTVYCVENDCFYISTGNGALKVTSVQLEGKKRMSAADFLRGNSIEEGISL